VLHDLSLDIQPGERVGLIGRSGAGKSTLVNLLLRFHDPATGRITIDGQDIKSLTQESLRGAIGMVTQDTSLLHRSIAENIRYGRPEASMQDVIDAAREAHAFDFIEELEDWDGRRGFDAHVGERGVKLSGGQRQRIAIARVILKDAPILVLDEATSALDSEVEAAIQEQLACHVPPADELPGDQPVDDGGDAGWADCEAIGQDRRDRRSLGEQSQHPVLGQGELDVTQGDLRLLGQPCSRPAWAPGPPGVRCAVRTGPASGVGSEAGGRRHDRSRV
jgi:ABC-type polar amino acid transport system ATPase subunit